jgi:putative ABC transport system permease protein
MLTILSIVIGVTALMNMQGVLRGLTSVAYSHMMDIDTAQVQIEAADYRADARRFPLDFTIRETGKLARMLAGERGVAAVSARVDAAFEVTNGVRGVRAMARGVSAAEVDVTTIGRAVVRGSFLRPGEPGLLLGSGLAAKLGLEVGDPVFYTALDRKSARNLGAATVVGIFDFGYPLMDDFTVYIDIDQARSFLGLGEDESTRLAIRGERPQDSRKLANTISAILAGSGNGYLAAHEWKVFAESLVSTVETRVVLLGTILVVLFALIVAGIFNSMSMNVQERYREIGTLRAIGMRRWRLVRLFMVEGLLLGLAGCAISALPSTLSGLLLGGIGIDISTLLPRDIPIPFGSRMYAVYSAADALKAIAAALAAAFLGSLVPAFRAAQVPITDALGNTR